MPLRVVVALYQFRNDKRRYNTIAVTIPFQVYTERMYLSLCKSAEVTTRFTYIYSTLAAGRPAGFAWFAAAVLLVRSITRLIVI